MGLGIINARSPAPGTATIEELDQPDVPHAELHKLKRSPHGIILVPQPTDDPEDPLNWPIWRRDLMIVILAVFAVVVASGAILLAADTLTLLIFYDAKYGVTPLALLTGYNLLGTAISAAIAVPSARVWGKRHVYVIAGAIFIVASLWGAGSGKNYDSLAGARFFQGLGLGPFESLLNASVGDLYHVHERGLRYAFVNTLLFGGTFLTPVVVGYLTKEAGWQWSFWIIAIVAGALYPGIVFLCPESAYRRDKVVQRYDSNSVSDVAEETKDGAAHTAHEVSSTQDTSPTTTRPKLISRRSLRLFTGRKTDDHFFRLFLRPFPLFLNPGIAFSCITLGTMIGWTTLIGLTLSITFAGAPLAFNEVQTGYLYTGAFVGSAIGLLFSGLADIIPRWLAHRNRGVFEPEFRLVLVIGQLVFGVMGLIGYGYTASNLYEYGAIIPDMFFGFLVAGMVLGTVSAASYIVDGYRDVAVEGLTCTVLYKNLFSFALTVRGFDWLLSQGVFSMFITVGCIQAGLCCLAIPMWIFGKQNRAFWARNDMFKALHLE